MMRFRSTRGGAAEVGFSDALIQGLAPDGGLYVPVSWPQGAATRVSSRSLPEIADTLLAPFAQGDRLSTQLSAIVREAFDFPAPLVTLEPNGRLSVLELFHGPTAAFKDFGARFLAASFARLRQGESRKLKILVATSGDTGGAVAAAFHNRAGIEVAVLFPKGLVSPTQERQLTCWGGNVQSFAVRGTFDECQRLVKEAFADRDLRAKTELSSANSINLGRLAPQMVYYAAASLSVSAEHGEPASFIIPSGNLGNALACLWAKHLGWPIAKVVLAHNVNRAVPDYFASGQYAPRASIATLACAMDVGNPSNFERLQDLFPHLSNMRDTVSACSVTDDEIRARIRFGAGHYGQVWCPHTATAAEAFARLSNRDRENGKWVLVATAHPAKFREIVAPLIGAEPDVPRSLAQLYARPTEVSEIDATLDALRLNLR